MGSVVPAGWPARVVAGLLVWYALVVAVWAVRPLTDTVGTGVDDDDRQTSETVACHAPVSRDGSVRGELPVPESGQPYERPPCESTVQEAWRLLAVDTAVVVAGCAAAGYAARRERRPDPAHDDKAGIAPALESF